LGKRAPFGGKRLHVAGTFQWGQAP
jgi:hypothetical protein